MWCLHVAIILAVSAVIGAETTAPSAPSPTTTACIVATSRTRHLTYAEVQALDNSSYSRTNAEELAAVACDKTAEPTTRECAASKLWNYSNHMPEDHLRAIQARLVAVLKDERANTPDNIVRTLVQWGYGTLVYDTIGAALQGEWLEIEMLEDMPPQRACSRLW